MKKVYGVLAALSCVAVLMVGCSKSLNGSSFNYASGNLSATLNADVQKAYDASVKAVDELQLVRSENVKDALGAKIVVKTSADKKVKIMLTRVSDTTTSLTISVGTVGDKDVSMAIYDKIMENLK